MAKTERRSACLLLAGCLLDLRGEGCSNIYIYIYISPNLHPSPRTHNVVCHEWCAMTWDVSEGNSFRTTPARMV